MPRMRKFDDPLKKFAGLRSRQLVTDFDSQNRDENIDLLCNNSLIPDNVVAHSDPQLRTLGSFTRLALGFACKGNCLDTFSFS